MEGFNEKCNILWSLTFQAIGFDDDEEEGYQQIHDCGLQCQRYEERITELHSVIAELSKKLQLADDVIVEEESDANDSFESEQKDGPDFSSLVFERDLEPNSDHASDENDYDEVHDPREGQDESYKIELFDEIHAELFEVKAQNEDLEKSLATRDEEVEKLKAVVATVESERDSLKRQLSDIQTTIEFQEAKMDSNDAARNKSERRSFRKVSRSRKVMKSLLLFLLFSLNHM